MRWVPGHESPLCLLLRVQGTALLSLPPSRLGPPTLWDYPGQVRVCRQECGYWHSGAPRAGARRPPVWQRRVRAASDRGRCSLPSCYVEGAQEHLWVTLPAPRPRDPGLKLLLWDRTWASVWGSERAPGGPCLTPTSRFPVTLWNEFQVDSHPKTPVANSPGCWRAVRSQRATDRTAPLGGSGSLPVSPARDSPKRQRGRPRRWGGSGSPSSPMPPSRPGPHRTVCQPQRARPPHAPVASPRPGPPTWAEEARVCQDGRPRPPRNPSPRPAAASVATTSKSGRKVILDRCVTAPASLRSCGGRW